MVLTFRSDPDTLASHEQSTDLADSLSGCRTQTTRRAGLGKPGPTKAVSHLKMLPPAVSTPARSTIVVTGTVPTFEALEGHLADRQPGYGGGLASERAAFSFNF
jgi:hypothetical protein